MINRTRLAELRKKEDARFLAMHPKSGEMFEQGKKNMPGGVPMSWMAKWPGAYPIFVENAKGARFTDVDGNTYIDFCLGDTGSMTGHSPDATVAAIREQVGKGITAMLPTADAAIVSAELARRFGLPLWQFTVSATDANRHVIRYSRMITGRSKIVVIHRVGIFSSSSSLYLHNYYYYYHRPLPPRLYERPLLIWTISPGTVPM